ncbi:MAG: AAA family ATPase [Gemmatimonas sp.]|jgi:NadR type nicotinamide-nucleotide adenylyltransferase|uniref:AAA family ATPase n=1 Tax=Gemmatimonas sp. TaxID=1962908 RepID=UPI00391FAD61|nr:ATP-binding protein [Gemmatimonadota bacterium]
MSPGLIPPARLVITGSECVGKTTLATEVAARYGTLSVPEFARGYAERQGVPLTIHDVEPIARGQVALEQAYLARAREAGHQFIVHDTDVLSTVAYSHHYHGECPPVVEALASARRADRYLLLDIDVPWVPDGVRDRGERRHEVQTLFLETLTRFAAPFTVVRGSWDDRLRAAVAEIDRFLMWPARPPAGTTHRTD